MHTSLRPGLPLGCWPYGRRCCRLWREEHAPAISSYSVEERILGAGDQRLHPLARDALLMLGGAYLCFEGVEKAGTSMAARGGTRSACASPV